MLAAAAIDARAPMAYDPRPFERPSRSRRFDASHPVKRKAQSNLAASKELLKQGLLDSSASRLYYALFQAAVEAMSTRGKSPRDFDRDAEADRWRHDLLRNNASLCRGQRDDRKLFQSAYDLRVQADYDAAPVTEPQVKAVMPGVERFVQSVCA